MGDWLVWAALPLGLVCWSTGLIHREHMSDRYNHRIEQMFDLGANYAC